MKQTADPRFRTTFGKLIEALLAEKGQRLGRKISLNELAFRADVDVSNLWRSMYTKGREGRPPSPDILKRVSQHLNISYVDLLLQSGHKDLADAVSDDSRLEGMIQQDPTLAPDVKMQLSNYLQFLRKGSLSPRLA